MGIQTVRHALYTPGTPPAPTASTAVGFNISADNGFSGTTETAQQAHDRYLSSFGISVLPVAKMFYGGTITSWASTFEGVVTGKRVIICYNAKTTRAAAAAGDMDADIAAHAASVPRGWHVYYVYFQEPDDEFKAGTANVADYKAVYARHLPIIHAAQKAPNPGAGLLGNRLEMWSCFTIPFNLNVTAATSASWQPDVCDGYGWDAYLNPNGVGGTRYNSLYDQPIPTRFATAIDVMNLNGVYRHGIMEWGAPWRNWDNGAQARDTYSRQAADYWLAGFVGSDSQLHKPDMICWFDRKGTNWDQRLVAAGVPTTFDHSGGPGGPDNPATVPVPVTPDEPFTVSWSAYIDSGLQVFSGDPGDV